VAWVATLAGCHVRVGSPEQAQPPATAGADELARERVARDADALGALAARTRALVPAVRAALGALVADHRAHAAALRPAPPPSSRTTSTGAAPSPGSATPAGSAGTSSPAGRASVPAVPALTPATALPALLRAERAAAASATAELDRVSGDVARLLASVAASRSLHVAVLEDLLAARSTTAAPRGARR
jgi:hypothetical protein